MNQGTERIPEEASGNWGKLVQRHRETVAARGAEVPFGFALRVAARWREDRAREILQVWERVSLRAAFASSAAVLVVAGLSAFREQGMAAEEELIPVMETRAEEMEWLLL